MAITHVATSTGTPTSSLSSTTVFTKPTGLAVGDLMVAVLILNEVGSLSAPSVRWTRLSQNDAGANIFRQEVWYCVATSSETAASNFTFTNGDANAPIWSACSAYRGVDQGSPINASNFSTQTTTEPQTGPSITTTSKAMILYLRTVRCSSGTVTGYSSSITNERFDGKNSGSGAVSYSGAMYDNGTETAVGSVSGTSIARSGGTQTDTISMTIALATADTTVSMATATATASAKTPTVGIGQSVTAGVATVAASAKTPQVLAGKVVNTVGVAQATAAVPDVIHYVRIGAGGNATATAYMPGLFFGTPSWRQLEVPYENRQLVVGQD